MSYPLYVKLVVLWLLGIVFSPLVAFFIGILYFILFLLHKPPDYIVSSSSHISSADITLPFSTSSIASSNFEKRTCIASSNVLDASRLLIPRTASINSLPFWIDSFLLTLVYHFSFRFTIQTYLRHITISEQKYLQQKIQSWCKFICPNTEKLLIFQAFRHFFHFLFSALNLCNPL